MSGLVKVPAGWRYDGPMVTGLVSGEVFRAHNGLLAIVSEDTIDGKRWLHVSLSRKGRIPSYEDIAWVKRCFVGDDAAAYQVFPRRKEHVNLHENCLHLWQPLDGDPFPEGMAGP